jgi:FixJ family two-component response regulator
MMTPTATVFVIDDDEAVRKSLGQLLGAAHYRIELFQPTPDLHASLSRRA